MARSPSLGPGSLIAALSRLSRHPQAASIAGLWLFGLVMVSTITMRDTILVHSTVWQTPPPPPGG